MSPKRVLARPASRNKSAGFFAPTLPGLRIRSLLPRLRPIAHFPFNQAGVEYFYNARSAIYTLAGSLDLRGRTVLFPSYCCGVDLEAVTAAGAVPRFYPVHRGMRVDVGEIVCRMEPSTKAVYLIHYLGFPGPVEELAAICRERRVRLIEDCALALFSRLGDRPLGSFGDAAVFSLYKSLPVPSGGVLVFNDAVARPLQPRRAPPVRSTLAHVRMSLMRNLEMNGNAWGLWALEMVRTAVRTMRPSVRSQPVIEIMTEKFDASVARYRMSLVSHWIARSTDPRRIVERRRANFLALHEALKNAGRPVFDRLPEGVCPLFYGVEVDDNRAAMAALRARGVEAWAWWWPVPGPLGDGSFPETDEMRRRIVVIPCHEAIDPAGIERVADVVIDVLDSTAHSRAGKGGVRDERPGWEGGH